MERGNLHLSVKAKSYQQRPLIKRMLFLISFVLISLPSFAQFTQITHTAGTVAYGGISVTVSNVPPGIYSSTCTLHHSNVEAAQLPRTLCIHSSNLPPKIKIL